jgi:hypothetical protein
MKYEDMIEVLLQRIPEIREVLVAEERLSEDLPYVVFGSLARYILGLLANRPLSDPLIQRSFQLLNDMGNSDDREVVDLATAGVYEVLTDEPAGIRAARELLYGRAIDHFEDVIRLWGIDVREP